MNKDHPKPLQVGDRPITPGIPNPTCPIMLEAQQVLERSRDLHRAIRKLRWSTQRCVTCPERRECPTHCYFNQAIDTAIRELRAEWGVDRE